MGTCRKFSGLSVQVFGSVSCCLVFLCGVFPFWLSFFGGVSLNPLKICALFLRFGLLFLFCFACSVVVLCSVRVSGFVPLLGVCSWVRILASVKNSANNFIFFALYLLILSVFLLSFVLSVCGCLWLLSCCVVFFGSVGFSFSLCVLGSVHKKSPFYGAFLACLGLGLFYSCSPFRMLFKWAYRAAFGMLFIYPCSLNFSIFVALQ